MKNKIIRIAFTSTVFLLIYFGSSGILRTTNGGAPVDILGGHTGGTYENGRTCLTSGCHSGVGPIYNANMITSDAPATGYIPGQTYNITVAIDRGGSKFGFQASPQTFNGDKIGRLVSISNSYIVDSTFSNYTAITHTTLNNLGSVPKLFAFQWEAPATSQGTAYIFVAANAANGNNQNTGDTILIDTLIIPSAQGGGIGGLVDDIPKIHAYTNAGNDQLMVSIYSAIPNDVTFQIFDINGRKMIEQDEILNIVGNYNAEVDIAQWQSGLYFIHFSGERLDEIVKFIKW